MMMASIEELNDSQTVCTLGNLRLNLENFRATIGHEVVDLTYLEVELLRLLCLRPNAVVQYHELSAALWQRTNRASARHLNVLIHRLRTKLAGSHPYSIETVRGRGYGLLTSRETEYAFSRAHASVESPLPTGRGSPVPFVEASRRTEGRQ